MRLTVGARIFAELRPEEPRGAAALGACRLIVPLAIEVRATLADLGGALESLQGELLVRLGGETLPAAMLRPEDGPVVIQAGQVRIPTCATLVADLTLGQVERLEEVRAGAEPRFLLRVFGVVRTGEEVWRVSDQMDWLVPRERWIAVLTGMKYGRVLLVEVPIPETDGDPGVAKAAALLGEAQRAQLRGEFREAVGCCRASLEALEGVVGRGEGPQEPDRKKRSKGARLREVRTSIRALADLAHHPGDQVGSATVWTRSDSLAAVTMVAAILNWYRDI